MVNNMIHDNHYLSQGYLKQWRGPTGKVMVYSLLVSHEKVPLWTEKEIKGIGYKRHLYTRYFADGDGLERWFSREFEAPAQDSIEKVVSRHQLNPDDWKRLVRFLALHDVRTPMRLVEHFEEAPRRWGEAMEDISKEIPDRLSSLGNYGEEYTSSKDSEDFFPIKITRKIDNAREHGALLCEVGIGRASWLWYIERPLTHLIKFLHENRWTIMRPARGMQWFTSDNPVVKLNYYGSSSYNLKGGWGSNGTEIFMPINPEFMIYTQIGQRPPNRNSRFSEQETKLVRKLIAENAHRLIIASSADDEVPVLRERMVNAEKFKDEQEQWNHFHSKQLDVEREFFVGV